MGQSEDEFRARLAKYIPGVRIPEVLLHDLYVSKYNKFSRSGTAALAYMLSCKFRAGFSQSVVAKKAEISVMALQVAYRKLKEDVGTLEKIGIGKEEDSE